MLLKKDVVEKSAELGFADIGFTTVEPFTSQKEILEERKESYQHLRAYPDMVNGTDPRSEYPEAKAIIVLLEAYFNESYPVVLETHFGRCYLDDDRRSRDRLYPRIKAFRGFLRDHGIQTKVPGYVPHRLSAARAGVANFGKNNFLYANRVNAGSSWILPIVMLVNTEFDPDEPTIKVGCPDWCRNTCVAACPTRAILGPNKLDPTRCISYMSYYSREITPAELREPMGTWIYGCDRCQNVCPRNAAWRTRTLPLNQRVAAKADDFELPRLMHMDKAYFESRILPHMFYIDSRNMWLWKMNTARAMGNSLNPDYVPDLIRAFKENDDERVKGMIAWSLGKLGGKKAHAALNEFLSENTDLVKEEIKDALKRL